MFKNRLYSVKKNYSDFVKNKLTTGSSRSYILSLICNLSIVRVGFRLESFEKIPLLMV